MNPDLLLAHFDRIGNAPDAIPRLRRFVLDLAVRGRLVEQDPSDEPASELLKHINSEKAKLVKARINNQQNSMALSTDFEFPFVIPSGWAFSSLQSICLSVTDGDHLPPPKADQGIPFLVIGNVRNQTLSFVGCRHVTDQYYKDLDPIRRPKKGDILYTLVGSYGIPVMITDDRQFCVQRHIGILRPSLKVNARFLFRILDSKWVFDQATACATGIAQKTVPLAGLRKMLIPLPPIAEQLRIVDKVDELMALCDRLELARTEQEGLRDRLIAASHHHLSDGSDADARRNHSHFFIGHLARLTARPDQIKQLRQTILDLAVRGRLLRPKINEEVVFGTRDNVPVHSPGRGRPVSLLDGAWPYELPGSWKWYRLETISDGVTDGEHATPQRIDERQVPLVTAKNVRDGFMDYSDTDWVSYETAAKAWKRCRPTVGDLLLVCVGATTGRLCILREPKDMVLVRSVALIRPATAVRGDYMALVLRSPMSQKQIWEKVKVSAQPCLYINRINSLSIPLPPVAEQQLIVAKVDELMTLCDQLEAQLGRAQTEAGRLLESVLFNTLNDDERRLVEG